MSHRRIPFDSMEWLAGGHPLERKKADPSTPVTLLEFAAGFADPNWCLRGHSGLVLEGVLRMEFERDESAPGGATGGISHQDYAAGDGFHIQAGTRHRASNPGTTHVRLFIVSTDP